MADNSTMGGSTDVLRDKDRAGVKTQIFGLDVNIGGTEALMSSANPLPIYGPDIVATGTITTTDIVVGAPAGTGVLLTGASTAGSLVACACGGGDSAWNVQITGLTTGTLYYEESLDSTNGTDGQWIAVNGRQSGIVNTTLSNSATANGVYRGNTSGAKWWRIRSVGALTGTPAITIRVSDGAGAVFLNASIPAGTNTVGAFKKAPATTGTITAPAISATSFTVLASNANRLGGTVFNDSSVVLYLALAATASTTSYTVQVPPGGYYELPNDGCGYTGIMTGIATTATGNIRVTELT